MRRLARAIATVGGIGYLPKAPGTAASLVGLLLGLLVAPSGDDLWSLYPPSLLAIWAVSFGVGVAASTQAERAIGRHDPSCVVIDETIGMWAVVLAIPLLKHSVAFSAVALGVFRLFDILKTPLLNRLARLPGGWGIMADDLGAALYTVLALVISLALWALLTRTT